MSKKYGITWINCIDLGADNILKIGKHKSWIVKVSIILMGCPCHIAHNTARKSIKAFCDHNIEDFDIEELVVDIYFHFDHSSKRKSLLK